MPCDLFSDIASKYLLRCNDNLTLALKHSQSTESSSRVPHIPTNILFSSDESEDDITEDSEPIPSTSQSAPVVKEPVSLLLLLVKLRDIMQAKAKTTPGKAKRLVQV